MLILAISFVAGCKVSTTEAAPDVYWTVGFETDGGEPIDSQTVIHNGKIMPVSAVRDGYSFTGWYRDSNFNSVWDFDINTVTKDTTLYAEWYEIPEGYVNVNFITDGGSLVADQLIQTGGKVTLPPSPAKKGFAFVSWYSDAELTAKWNFGTNSASQSMTLYAKWQVAFTVAFNSNGGSAVEKQLIPEGSAATEPAAPSKDGYRFSGWYKEKNFATLWNFDANLTKDMTLYAKWEKVTGVTVTFNTNSPFVIPSITVPSGEKIKRPRISARADGRVCIGWFLDNETFKNEFDFLTMEVTKNITLYAEWGTAVNVWLSSNHNGGIFDGGTGSWDQGAEIDDRLFLQRKDGTHYMDLTCENANDYYFRFWIQANVNGNSWTGRLQPASKDLPVDYNNPMAMLYSYGTSVGDTAWKFNSDGDFVILLDIRDDNNRNFILTQPYTVTGVNVSPASYAKDYGTAFTQQYSVAVTGKNPPKAVTWSLEGATGGSTISQTGLVSVTADETPKTLTIRATSKAAPKISGTASLVLQVPSNVPVVTGVIVSPTSAAVMKAVLANGSTQTHSGNVPVEHRGQQFTASGNASGGATQKVTYSIVETDVKPGTAISAAGYLTVALNEERTNFTVRVASAEPGFEGIYTDVPVTVKSFSVWLVGAAFQWGRSEMNKMTDNGNGTYTWTGSLNNTSASEGFSFNTNKATGGGDGGNIGWGADAWYTLQSTTAFNEGTFSLRTYNDQKNMFSVSSERLDLTYTIVLDVTTPSVTVTLVP